MRTSVVVCATACLSLGVMPATAATHPGPIEAVKASPLSAELQELTATPQAAQQELVASGPGSILTDAQGRVIVDIRLTDTAAATLDRLRNAGAAIRVVDKTLRTVTAAVDVKDIAALAPLVVSAREERQPQFNGFCPTGVYVTEGVAQLRADLGGTNFHVTGRDVTVGVISNSYDNQFGAFINTLFGELPGPDNPCGFTTPVGVVREGTDHNDEGRGMLQLIHDVAPGAALLFATADGGQLAFAQSIRDLAGSGADIIVDDVTDFSEPIYQDGIIARAVNDVTAQGVVYFSAAANANATVNGKSAGSYEAQAFRPTSCPSSVASNYSPFSVECHDFGVGVAPDPTYGIGLDMDHGEDGPHGQAWYTLGWNEPMYGVVTDLDLCYVKMPDTLLGCETTNNITTGEAVSFKMLQNGVTDIDVGIVIVSRGGGSPRLKLINHGSNLDYVEYGSGAPGDVFGPTIFGHNASQAGATVAAVPFNNDAVVEPYSSRGPATYCWKPVNGPTPSAALSPCQTATIDVAGTDGGSTSFFGDGGMHRFFGTSAAAPHAAAVAALMLDREPCLAPAQVIAALKSTGRTVGAFGVDDAGGGLVDANAALAAVGSAKCDKTPPMVNMASTDLWHTTASVTVGVNANDRRTVSGIVCSDASFLPVGGFGTPDAWGAAQITGEGTHTVTCTGTDFEGNAGAAAGSHNTVQVGIDTGPPALVCQAAPAVTVGQVATITAAVTDDVSGPAVATAKTIIFVKKAGKQTVAVTATDVAGNSGSVSCPFTAKGSLRFSGRTVVKVKRKFPYAVRGLPAQVPVVWRVLHRGQPVLRRNDSSNAAGASKVTLRLGQPGKYVVRVSGAGMTRSVRITVR